MLLRFAPWKILLIILTLGLGVMMTLPNIVPEEERGWLPTSPIKLGLDLRGGASILLEMDPNELLDNRLGELSRDIGDGLRSRPSILNRREVNEGELVVALRRAEPGDLEQAISRIKKLGEPPIGAIGAPNTLNVQARGTDRIVVTLTDDAFQQLRVEALDNSIEGVRRRVDSTGTLEPNIQKEGDARIRVEVPGLADPAPLIAVLTQAGVLTFNMVDQSLTAEGMTVGESEAGRIALQNTSQGIVQVLYDEPIITGSDLSGASQGFDEYNQPNISFQLRPAGAKRFGDATRENVGELFAIVLDDVVLSAPIIRGPITGGSGVIEGNFTLQEAQNLSIILRSGALPAKLKVVEQRLVGPGLGKDSIESGVTAAVVGLGLVAVFMLLAYGLLGIFAVTALFFNILLIFGALSGFGATLTLPGIGGILLTIGMAVDANVLIFERIREEKRNGRSPMSSVETGYQQAKATILDANVTTLIAALILYFVGSGPVRGFAVTLSIGVITSMFTAIVLARFFMSMWLKTARPKAIPI